MGLDRYINAFYIRLYNKLYNYKGWKTERKIVVIESDDWGSIRLPNVEALQQLKNEYPEYATQYNHFDSLETDNDLTALFDILSSVKDINSKPAIITANALMSNPDFKRIKDNGFNEYYYETIDNTFNNSLKSKNCLALWHEGNYNNVFRIQSHGREHLNVRNWIEELKKGNKALLYSFNLGFFSITPKRDNGTIIDILPACQPSKNDDIKYINEIVSDGLILFNKIMGYKSKTFIAANYKWSSSLEEVLEKNGVIGIQGNISHRYTSFDEKEGLRLRKIGINQNNLIDIARNVIFEPTFDKNDSTIISNTLKSIDTAFKYNKPAIICSHRVNYVSNMSISNRDRSLKLLKHLLYKIKKLWPDVEFLSSDMLCEHIKKTI